MLLSDGTVLKLNAGTAVRLLPGKLRLDRGELWAKVAKAERPFLVETGVGTVEVLGTQFNLQWQPDRGRAELAVLEGKVRFHGVRAEAQVSRGMHLVAQAAQLSDPQPIANERTLIAWTHFRSGQEQLLAGRSTQAVGEFRKAIEEQPEHLAAHQALFEALLKSGRLLVTRDSAESKAYRLKCTYRDGSDVDVSQSVTLLEALVAKDPTNARAHAVLGFLQAHNGDLEGARRNLQQAVALDPFLGEPYAILGFLEHLQDNDTAAEQALLKGVSLAPRWPLAHALAGVYWADRGSPEQAFQAFRRQLELDPYDGDAWVNLALLHWHRGNPEDSFAAAKKALEVMPSSPGCAAVFGTRCELMNRYAQGLPVLQEAARQDPQNATAVAWLGICHLRTGDLKRGESYLRTALRSVNCPVRAYTELAALYSSNGLHRTALAAVSEGAKRFPESDDLALAAERVTRSLPESVNTPAAQQVRRIVAQRHAELPQLLKAVRELDRGGGNAAALAEGQRAYQSGDFDGCRARVGALCEQQQLGVFCHLGQPPVLSGLEQFDWNNSGHDGVSAPVRLVGHEARQTNYGSDNGYLYFRLTDESKARFAQGAFVIVSTFEAPAGRFLLEYDSTDPAAPQDGAYKASVAAEKRGSKQWAYHVFYLPDPRFAGRQNGNADFRLRTRDGKDTAVRWVCVLPAVPGPDQPAGSGKAVAIESSDSS